MAASIKRRLECMERQLSATDPGVTDEAVRRETLRRCSNEELAVLEEAIRDPEGNQETIQRHIELCEEVRGELEESVREP